MTSADNNAIRKPVMIATEYVVLYSALKICIFVGSESFITRGRAWG